MDSNTRMQTSLKFTQRRFLITFGEIWAHVVSVLIFLHWDKIAGFLFSLGTWETLMLFVNGELAVFNQAFCLRYT